MACAEGAAGGIATLGRLPPYAVWPKTALAATDPVRAGVWGGPTSGGETMFPRAALRMTDVKVYQLARIALIAGCTYVVKRSRSEMLLWILHSDRVPCLANRDRMSVARRSRSESSRTVL